MFVLWGRYWFLYYVFWFNVYIMKQILIPILYLLAQCFYGLLIQRLYYEADTCSYAIVVRSMFLLWGRYWFLYYACSLNVCIMGQVLVPILCLFAQCMYYGAVAGSYAMLVGSIPILWGRHWFLYYVFWFNV
jgi:hypothetical protein